MGRTRGKKADEAPAPSLEAPKTQNIGEAFKEVVKGKSADSTDLADAARDALQKFCYNPTSADIEAAKLLIAERQEVNEKNVALAKLGLKITPRTLELSHAELKWLRSATQTSKYFAQELYPCGKKARPDLLPLLAEIMPEHAVKGLVILARNMNHSTRITYFLNSFEGCSFIIKTSNILKNNAGFEREPCLSDSEKAHFLLAASSYFNKKDSEKMHSALIAIGNEIAERAKQESAGDSLYRLLEVEGVTPTDGNLKAAEELVNAHEPVTKATVELKKAGIIRCQETLLLDAKQLTAVNAHLHKTGYLVYAMRNEKETYAEQLPTLVKYVPVYAAERICELAAQPFVPAQLSDSLKKETGKKFLKDLADALKSGAPSYEENPVLTSAERIKFVEDAKEFLESGNESALQSFISELMLLGEKIKERKQQEKQES